LYTEAALLYRYRHLGGELKFVKQVIKVFILSKNYNFLEILNKPKHETISENPLRRNHRKI